MVLYYNVQEIREELADLIIKMNEGELKEEFRTLLKKIDKLLYND